MTAGEFTAYGGSHWVVLAVFALGTVAAVAGGRRLRNTPAAQPVSWCFAAVLLVSFLVVRFYSAAASGWSIDRSVPLQLSDLAGPVAAYALWSQSFWACALTYYWCLSLSTQALFTPVLTVDFPQRDFFAFWGLHLFVVWAAIYLTWGLGIRPNWRAYRITVAVSATWAVTAFVVNAFTGNNFGFVNRKPETSSLLDLLGPWPWYLIPEVTLVLVAWALMTWPWVHAQQRHPLTR
ncbi:TIGR02206 family membrane protein [Saccharomonospora sp. NPDC046836]|uniref:YwaF family protein n=1 Tax=Saccharomonospora sp. NPDC046836 TaxID=3156921 RepID=UPI00340FBCBE